MKKILLSFALAVGLLTSASTLQAQVNTSRYITLTVTNGAAIKLDFKAAAANTPVRIVSGSNTQDITVGTDWTGFANYTAGSTTMTVYGDIINFDCAGNGANITALDLSQNTQLTVLNCRNNSLNSLDISQNTQLEALCCYGNNFSTQALDDIYCALPNRTGKEYGVIYPVYNSSSSDIATVLATNAQNAIAKNWKVQYYDGKVNITTTGSYVCGTPHPEPNMSSYITLTVAKDSAINLNFQAAADDTPVRIVSGSNTRDITVGTGWTGYRNYTAGSTTMTVYGDIISFDCSDNITKVTAIDVSNNTQLTMLNCGNNKLSSLDVSHNTQLTWLNCSSNQLTSLDVSGCTQLTELYCSSNTLRSLDVSHNTQLERLICHGNKFSAQALDDIYCALPDRTSKEYGVIYPVYNSSSSNHATVLATKAQNAIAKKWKVKYYATGTDIPATTGTYVCGTPHPEPEPNMNSYITLTVAKDSAINLNFQAAADDTPVRIVSGSNTRDITVGTNWIGIASYTAGSTTMTVYGDLIGFDCSQNGANLTALDPSHNTQLTWLNCSSNQLTSLDVSHNTQLMGLGCYNNRLSNLDISHNTQLTGVYCYGNKFTTATLDDIYCALPDRTSKEYGVIYPVYNSSSSNHATVLATNAQNAITKNWKVQYYYSGKDIPATTGKHKCSATDIADASAEPALTLYPNPVADVLYLSATARTVRIYNVYGTEVAYATDTDRIDVAHLPAGVYTVKADGTVAKMVKR